MIFNTKTININGIDTSGLDEKWRALIELVAQLSTEKPIVSLFGDGSCHIRFFLVKGNGTFLEFLAYLDPQNNNEGVWQLYGPLISHKYVNISNLVEIIHFLPKEKAEILVMNLDLFL